MAGHPGLPQAGPWGRGRWEAEPGPPGASGSSVPLVPAELPQAEITKAYFAKQADEVTLQQADVVLVLQEEDGEQGQGARG